MKSYTFSEARQNFAALLEQALRDGAVQIQGRGGQSFVLMPEPATTSPLDITGVTQYNRSAAVTYYKVFKKAVGAMIERCVEASH